MGLFRNTKSYEKYQNTELLMKIKQRQARTRLMIHISGVLLISYCSYLKIQTSNDYLKYSITRWLSRQTGKIASYNIPLSMREFLYSYYINFYGVNRTEIRKELKEFQNFQEFFMREVKEREINMDVDSVLSPADAEILSLQEVTSDKQQLMDIKGCRYSLGELVTGIRYRTLMKDDIKKAKKNQELDKDGREKTKLIQMTLYLSPKDYHRFHSPSDITIDNQYHIYGHLYPVKKSYVQKYPQVYGQNERVCLLGSYKGGFMAIVFVGALNVGSILIHHDQQLVTNDQSGLDKDEDYMDGDVRVLRKPMWEKKVFKNSIALKRGQEIGAFRLGSSIVMILEVNRDAQLLVQNGDTIRYGQPIIINK